MESIKNTGDLINLFEIMYSEIKKQYSLNKSPLKQGEFRRKSFIYWVIKEEFSKNDYLVTDCQINKLVALFTTTYKENPDEKNGKSIH